jgi:hypothetical protein
VDKIDFEKTDTEEVLGMAIVAGTLLKGLTPGPLVLGQVLSILVAGVAKMSYDDCPYDKTIKVMCEGIGKIEEKTATLIAQVCFNVTPDKMQVKRKATDPAPPKELSQ